MKQIKQGPIDMRNAEANPDFEIDQASDNFPEKTSLVLDGIDPRDKLTLVSGKGSLRKALHA